MRKIFTYKYEQCYQKLKYERKFTIGIRNCSIGLKYELLIC
jgi:hypothetical protein